MIVHNLNDSPQSEKPTFYKLILLQWRIQDGAFGANAPPPPSPTSPVEELLIKILNFVLGQDQFSYKTHENMHALVAFIIIHLKPKSNQL